MSISIIDYGMANLRSVQKAFEQVGARAGFISEPEQIDRADKIVLPEWAPSGRRRHAS